MFDGTQRPRIIKRKDYEGEYGNIRHITRVEEIIVPLSKLLDISGVKNEKREFHDTGFGNYSTEQWNNFLEDLKINGLKEPVFIVVDRGGPRISEGNHRIQAAKQLGWKTMWTEVRYFGHSERDSYNRIAESLKTFKEYLNGGYA